MSNRYSEYEKKESSKNGVMVIVLLVLIVFLMVYLYNSDSSVKGVIDSFTKKTNNNSESKIDLNKCINNKTNKYSLSKGDGSIDGLSISYDKENVYLDVDKDKFNYNVVTGKYLVDNINKSSIKNVFIDGIGQDAMSTSVFFLLNNGDVSYFKLFTDGEFKVVDNKFNAISLNLKDIVKLYSAESKNTIGYHTVLAALKDGSFYDLALLLDSNENKKTTSEASDSKKKNANDDSANTTTNNNPFDSSKCINDKNVTYSSVNSNGVQNGISISYDNDNILINVDANTFANGTTKAVSGTYNVNGVLKSEVKDAYVDGIGQSAESMMVFFLLNNGKIKYFKLFNNMYAFNTQNKAFTAYTIGVPEDVVKLYSANASTMTGYHTVLAMKDNGMFYNLNGYIK